MADIFISYSKADHALALKLSAFLEAEGWSVWWDKSLAAADLYRDEIMKQLAGARAVITIWRRNSVRSEWVRAEAGRAKADGKLIPVTTPDVAYADIPLPFGEMHTENVASTARVSTDGQTLDAQQAALKAAGAERTFAEKVSVAVTERKALTKALAALGTGDVLLVTRLDRLARSTRDLLNTLDAISKAGAKFKSLADAWADTTTPHGELMVTILAGLAVPERHLIRARTDEGRKLAKVNGVRFGRKPKLSAFQIKEAPARREAGEALVDIGRSYGVSHSTISRL
jgi:DNA invertase Pin-like site-specific DNA recombinase